MFVKKGRRWSTEGFRKNYIHSLERQRNCYSILVFPSTMSPVFFLPVKQGLLKWLIWRGNFQWNHQTFFLFPLQTNWTHLMSLLGPIKSCTKTPDNSCLISSDSCRVYFLFTPSLDTQEFSRNFSFCYNTGQLSKLVVKYSLKNKRWGEKKDKRM